MNLSPRLLAVCEFIPPTDMLLDIGSDHAQLPIYLVNSGRVKKALAVEKNRGPYLRSRRAVIDAGLESKIEVRQGNGLEAVDDDVNVIVIAGMGGDTIARICRDFPHLLQNAERVVLQPIGKERTVRETMLDIQMHLLDERLVRDQGRLYQVIAAAPGRGRVWTDPLILELGPMIIEKRDPLLLLHLQKALSRRRIKADGLKKSRHEKSDLKQLLAEINRLEEICRELEATNNY